MKQKTQKRGHAAALANRNCDTKGYSNHVLLMSSTGGGTCDSGKGVVVELLTVELPAANWSVPSPRMYPDRAHAIRKGSIQLELKVVMLCEDQR